MFVKKRSISGHCFAIVVIFVLTGCDLLPGIFQRHENLCREEARLIVHDAELWKQYLIEAEQTFSDRSERFPNTRRALIEYAPSFEHRYGSDLKSRPRSLDHEITRQDIYILKDGRIAAQFLNFYARVDFSNNIRSCIAVVPDLYRKDGNGL